MDYAEESWLILPIKNQLAQLSDKESTKKYYLIDNGLLSLFLYNGETTLLENIVCIELCRRYGKDNVSYYNANHEIDFVVEEARLAIQVTYSMQEDETRERELIPLAKFQSQHPDWTCLLVTNDNRDSYICDNQKLQAIPAYQWLLDWFLTNRPKNDIKNRTRASFLLTDVRFNEVSLCVCFRWLLSNHIVAKEWDKSLWQADTFFALVVL